MPRPRKKWEIHITHRLGFQIAGVALYVAAVAFFIMEKNSSIWIGYFCLGNTFLLLSSSQKDEESQEEK